jgi:hypothetical protein
MNTFWQRRFEGNSAIVIGAGARAGEATVRRFHQEFAAGAPVGISGQKDAAAELGDSAPPIPVDIATSNDIADAARTAIVEFGGLPMIASGGGPRIARRHHRVTGTTIPNRRSAYPHIHLLHTAPIHRGCRVGLNVTTIGVRRARDIHPGFSAAVQMPASAEGQPVVIASPEEPPGHANFVANHIGVVRLR